MKPNVKEIAIFGVFAALMYASKLAMDFLPNIHLIGVFIIALTDVYGKKALYPIYTFVFLTGLLNGFSTWWLPYLYIWFVLWLLVMFVPKKLNSALKTAIYMIICAVHGFAYGILYAPVHMFIYGMSFDAIVAWVVAGLPWDMVHGISNFFCTLLTLPIIKALKMGQKYSRQ